MLLAITAFQPFSEMSLSSAGNWPPALFHQPVDAAAPGENTLDRLLDLILAAQIGGEGEGVGIVELLLHLLELLRRAPDQGEARAQRFQLMGGAAAEARAAAGDDHGLAGEQAGPEDGTIVHGATRS